MNSDNYYRRHLPHYQPPNQTFFITFRLAGSLPRATVDQLRAEASFKTKNHLQIRPDISNTFPGKKHFEAFEALLDRCNSGPKWLHDDRIANIVEEAIHFRDSKNYHLECYCIMPNHVHMMVTLQDNTHVSMGRLNESPYVLTKIIGELKKYTALQANKILGRSGQFWQHESYDHVIRNEEEFNRMYWYILNNPVKAGLVEEWTGWRWSYTKYESREGNS